MIHLSNGWVWSLAPTCIIWILGFSNNEEPGNYPHVSDTESVDDAPDDNSGHTKSDAEDEIAGVDVELKMKRPFPLFILIETIHNPPGKMSSGSVERAVESDAFC